MGIDGHSLDGGPKIKAKKVEAVELFYDLIYVYCISKLESLVDLQEMYANPFGTLLNYVLTAVVILMSWIYMTNYVNRYGKWRRYDYFFYVINMFAVLYMSNTLSSDWMQSARPFCICMLIITQSVAILYLIQILFVKDNTESAKNSLLILLITCAIFLVGLIFARTGKPRDTVTINILAIVAGAALPFITGERIDPKQVNFPHLTERFQLFVVITFGESVADLAPYFKIDSFSIQPVMVFMIFLGLYGSYIVAVQNLVRKQAIHRLLILMFSHYLIIISAGLINIALKFICLDEDTMFLDLLLLILLMAYYGGVMMNRVYDCWCVQFTRRDYLILGSSYVIGGAVILLSPLKLVTLFGAMLIVGLHFLVFNKVQNHSRFAS